ncbi:2-oxoglutarate (2OG) and Fe(II)-dependent oxygenase superfamily protein [Euphorbia peplus]|nr:2-oxoglutarate (2OG) and Fe(II)-dependent oxygenase superfamily protein [Euphorbia peplus]
MLNSKSFTEHAKNGVSSRELINHGVSESLVEKVKEEIQEFFDLPMDEKKKYWQRPGEMDGYGQAFVVSEEQKLDWGDIFYMIITLPHNL